MKVDCIGTFPVIVTYGKAECGFIVFVMISTKTHINKKHKIKVVMLLRLGF